MNPADRVQLQIAAPPGWVGLPTDRSVDAAQWARDNVTAAAEGLEPSETSVGIDLAIESLASVTATAQEQAYPEIHAHFAMAFQPDPLGRVLASLTCSVFPFEEGRMDIDDVKAWLGRGGVSVNEPEVDELKLKAGRAVRLRRMFGVSASEGAPDPDELPEAQDVMEGITYVVLPKKVDGYVFVNALWSDVVLGDALAGSVDQAVQTLKVEVVR